MRTFSRSSSSSFNSLFLPLRELKRSLLGSPLRGAAAASFAAEASPAVPKGWNDNLYNRVVFAGDPSVPVAPLLEAWVAEGNTVEKKYLQGMIKQMKSSRRYAHGLEISTWMSDRRYFYLTPGDHADRLDLIHKVHGLEHVENYLNIIPKKLRTFQVYGALLNCYVQEKHVDKAEALFQKMKETSMLSTFSCNAMMKLYIDEGQLEKAEAIFENLENDGASPDSFTYSILLEAYADGSNIIGIEKIVEKSKRQDPCRWHTYAVAGKAYAKVGLIDEALTLLKKSENLLPKKKGRVTYGLFLSAYAETGMKDEVDRIWMIYKSTEKPSNTMYMCMMSMLLKLNDVKRAEDLLNEWESGFILYDFRVPNILISAYCARGLLEKAESLVNRAIESGKQPFANSWDKLASLCFARGESFKAAEMVKKALSTGKLPWKPNRENVVASLEYYKEQKDVDEAEAFVKLLQHHLPLTRDLYHCLLGTYVSAGRPVANLLDRMKDDGIDADEETQKILSGDL